MLANLFSPAIPPLMQSLIIVLLIALLAALYVIKLMHDGLTLERSFTTKWHDKYITLLAEHQANLNSHTQLYTDNTFLRAELKRKHRRVPKL